MTGNEDMAIEPGIDNSKIAGNSWLAKANNKLNFAKQNREYLFAKRRTSIADSATNFFDGKNRLKDFTDTEIDGKTDNEESDTDMEWSKVEAKGKKGKKLPNASFFLRDKSAPPTQENSRKRGAGAAELSPKG